MEGASVIRIDRKSSIESEPRTLGIDQIQYARVSIYKELFFFFFFLSFVVNFFEDANLVILFW
jgi:hypothetical protein